MIKIPETKLLYSYICIYISLLSNKIHHLGILKLYLKENYNNNNYKHHGVCKSPAPSRPACWVSSQFGCPILLWIWKHQRPCSLVLLNSHHFLVSFFNFSLLLSIIIIIIIFSFLSSLFFFSLAKNTHLIWLFLIIKKKKIGIFFVLWFDVQSIRKYPLLLLTTRKNLRKYSVLVNHPMFSSTWCDIKLAAQENNYNVLPTYA